MLHWGIQQTAEAIRKQINQLGNDKSYQLVCLYEALGRVKELDELMDGALDGDRASYVALKNLVNDLLFAVYDFFDACKDYTERKTELYKQVQSLYVMLREFKRDLTKQEIGLYL